MKRETLNLELAIVERAEQFFRKYRIPADDRITMFLDLENATKQYPLDLKALLAFPDQDFAHDWFGIRHHMNRQTGKLEDCFVPRCYRAKTDG